MDIKTACNMTKIMTSQKKGSPFVLFVDEFQYTVMVGQIGHSLFGLMHGLELGYVTEYVTEAYLTMRRANATSQVLRPR